MNSAEIEAKVEAKVWDAIRRTINKFRREPHYFFTESDIVSYLWKSLHGRQLVASAHNKQPVFLVHREYPTNFRYDDKKLLEMEEPYPLSERRGARGHFDLVVLSPAFVSSAPSVEDIVNRNIRNLEARFDPASEELLFAIEFKFIVSNVGLWERLIQEDNKKLVFAKKSNVRNVVNLVFCNIPSRSNLDNFKAAVRSADQDVCAAFIQSFYDTVEVEGIKQAVKNKPLSVIANNPDALAQIGYGPRIGKPLTPTTPLRKP